MFQDLSFLKMAQREEDGIHPGLYTPFEFPSIRGGIKIAYQGYCYVKEKVLKNGNIPYKCDYPNRGCKWRLTLNSSKNVISLKSHNMHAPDQAAVEIRISQARFKENASNQPVVPLSALLNQEISKVPQSIRPEMPSDNAMKRSAQRIRRKNFPPEPTCAQDVHLDGEWCKANGEEWLIYQNTRDENTCIILARKANLRKLKQSKVWYGDGTFDVSPKVFYQMYTIHSPVMGKILPMVYCLLSNKSSESYRQIFEVLNNEMQGECAVEKFRSDFEKAPIKEFLQVFPERSVEACFFHFAQANWCQIQRLGLSTLYQEDFNIKRLIKSFTALAFTPPNYVLEAFNSLKEVAENTEILEPFVAYFESTYIGKWISILNGNRIQLKWEKPLYAPLLWSVYNRVIEGEPRTTGNLEAWHRRFGTIVNKSTSQCMAIAWRTSEWANPYRSYNW